jgi:hypothetical protein
VTCFHVWSSECGNPHLCRLRTTSVGPCCNKHWLYTGACEIYGFRKLSSFDGHWVGRYLTSLHGCIMGWCSGHPLMPIEVILWKTALGWGRTRSRLFDSHQERWSLVLSSWLTCVVLSDYFLAWYIMIRIFTTPSDMGEACSLCPNVEVQTPLWSYENYINDMTTRSSRIWW